VDKLGLDPRDFAQHAGALQYVMREAKKPFSGPRLLVQSMVLAPVAAVNDVKIHLPGRFLEALPGVRVAVSQGSADLTTGRPDERKIFIWQRPILRRPESLKAPRFLLRAGYLIVVEFDDDPRRGPDIPGHGFLTFRGVHRVQTSTETLATHLRQFNPNVAIFPNQMAELPPPRETETDGPLTLFCGALNREAEWRPLVPHLNRVLAEYGNRLRVCVVHDRGFFDALGTRQKILEDTCPYSQYLELLKECDIGLLPLGATQFNCYKSELKFIEHAPQGGAVLASPTVHESSITEGETGLIFRSENAFEIKLRRLIDDSTLRRRIAANAYAWVRENRLLGRHYRDRYQWYLRMLDEVPRLDAELRRRVPNLLSEEA
jgi:hypothetical protein